MARERKAPETLTYEVPASAKKKAKKKAAPAVKKGIAKKTGGKAKKEKKPYKNAMNAYMFFVADERKKVSLSPRYLISLCEMLRVVLPRALIMFLSRRLICRSWPRSQTPP